MDKEELQKNIALYYSKLPPKAQEVFSSMRWLETLKEISLKFSLNDSQKETLGTETTLVLLGMISVREYEEKLGKELAIPKESADMILKEINNSVLSPISPDLSDAFEKNTNPQTEEEKLIEQKLDERFKKLPKNIQDIIIESNYYGTLYNISREHELGVAQLDALEEATTNVMLGVIPTEKFEQTVKNNLKLDDEKARLVTNAINLKILKEIREKVIGLHKQPAEPAPERAQTQELDLERIEIAPKPETDHVMLQKLSGTFQIPTAKTNHSLENISKSAMPTAPSSAPLKVDPYREIPE